MELTNGEVKTLVEMPADPQELHIARLERRVLLMRKELEQYRNDLEFWVRAHGHEYPLRRIKELEHLGFQFEAAEGSFEMLLRRASPEYRAPFELEDFTVIVEKRGGLGSRAQATVRIRVGDEMMHTAAEGDGPVSALDRAVRKALLPHYPGLADVHLVDYKVRIVDEHLGTGARPRVIIESARGAERWSTVGCSENIIEASWMALCDGLELAVLRGR